MPDNGEELIIAPYNSSWVTIIKRKNRPPYSERPRSSHVIVWVSISSASCASKVLLLMNAAAQRGEVTWPT